MLDVTEALILSSDNPLNLNLQAEIWTESVNLWKKKRVQKRVGIKKVRKLPLRNLYPFIKSFVNSFVDISLTSDRSFISFL